MSKRINVWSSYSVDSLVNEQGKVLATQAGGPALFIQGALKQEQALFKLNSDQQLDVEILVTSNGEFGRISKQPQKRNIDVEQSDWVMVSTILDEWQLVEPLPTKLFVDLQGFVRDGEDFGKKRPSGTIENLAGKIFCLKGTREEVSYLSKLALELQKRKLLIITDGDNGVELYYKGKNWRIPIIKVSGLADTIGAGDTYLAYFVVSMFRGDTPLTAAKYAATKTTQFLQAKLGVRR